MGSETDDDGAFEGRPRERPPAHPWWRRPALLLAIALDVAIALVAAVVLANGGSLVVLAIAAILGFAPWAAIIDDAERPRRK
jgi:hypothetical protein